MAIQFFDMFAGIGGFRSGLEAVGGYKCIGHCEIDKYANQAYNSIYNPKGELYFEDAKTINPNDLPDIDLICAGFPLLTASAMQKNSQAQYLLAKLYLCEDGIPKDAEKALHWLWESVKQKNQYAQYLLGKMLLFGKETDRDVETGIALLSASAEQGNVYAARLLQSYYSGRLRNPSLGMAAVRLLSQLGRMFTDRLRRNEDGQRAVIEKKLRQKIEEKKQAHGMKMG